MGVHRRRASPGSRSALLTADLLHVRWVNQTPGAVAARFVFWYAFPRFFIDRGARGGAVPASCRLTAMKRRTDECAAIVKVLGLALCLALLASSCGSDGGTDSPTAPTPNWLPTGLGGLYAGRLDVEFVDFELKFQTPMLNLDVEQDGVFITAMLTSPDSPEDEPVHIRGNIRPDGVLFDDDRAVFDFPRPASASGRHGTPRLRHRAHRPVPADVH